MNVNRDVGFVATERSSAQSRISGRRFCVNPWRFPPSACIYSNRHQGAAPLVAKIRAIVHFWGKASTRCLINVLGFLMILWSWSVVSGLLQLCDGLSVNDADIQSEIDDKLCEVCVTFIPLTFTLQLLSDVVVFWQQRLQVNMKFEPWWLPAASHCSMIWRPEL